MSKLVLTGLLALSLSLLTGFVFVMVLHDIAGVSREWLMWPASGLFFALWAMDEKRSRKQRR
jgi:hypothetical protein